MMTKEELEAEEYICNGKCQDDITKNYVHCKTCTRLKDFLAGYKVRKEELEAQIEKMKSDVKQLREDRMNDDTDQNIMDRLWEEWTVNFGVSN